MFLLDHRVFLKYVSDHYVFYSQKEISACLCVKMLLETPQVFSKYIVKCNKCERLLNKKLHNIAENQFKKSSDLIFF